MFQEKEIDYSSEIKENQDYNKNKLSPTQAKQIINKFDPQILQNTNTTNKDINDMLLSLTHEEPLKILNILYIHFDFYTNYCVVCLVFFIIKDFENNILIIVVYFFIIVFLCIRVTIIM